MKLHSSQYKKMAAGFTLIELLISISIFAFMTAFLVAKYGTFNQSVLLTNLAYDTALTVRSAQTYGLDVQGTATSSSALGFNYAYGVHFDPTMPTTFILFVDFCGDNIYRDYTKALHCSITGTNITTNETISTYTMRTGFNLKTSAPSGLCAGASSASCTVVTSALDITFHRPNPDALITMNANAASLFTYAKIPMVASDGSTKSVVVQSTGQIAVTN